MDRGAGQGRRRRAGQGAVASRRAVLGGRAGRARVRVALHGPHARAPIAGSTGRCVTLRRCGDAIPPEAPKRCRSRQSVRRQASQDVPCLRSVPTAGDDPSIRTGPDDPERRTERLALEPTAGRRASHRGTRRPPWPGEAGEEEEVRRPSRSGDTGDALGRGAGHRNETRRLWRSRDPERIVVAWSGQGARMKRVVSKRNRRLA
jgi:hypothetical protein